MPTQLGKHFWPDFSFVYGLRLDYLSPTIYFTDVLILLIFVFNLRAFATVFKKLSKKYLGIFLLFLLFLAVGLVNAKNAAAGIYGIVKFIELSFLVFYVAQNYKSFSKPVLIVCILLGVIFESSLAILQYLNQASLGGIFYFFGERTFNAGTPGIALASVSGQLFLRPYATFSHPNVLAGFLVLTMLGLLFFPKRNQLVKFAIVATIALGSVALLITLSRTAIFVWVGYLLLLFGIWIAKKYKKGKFNPRLLVGAVSICILLLAIISFSNNVVVQRFISTKLSDESIVQRQELISQSLTMFGASPLFGVGLNNFYNNLSFTLSGQRSQFTQPVHNIFLLVLSETGIVGFLGLCFIFLKSLRVAFGKHQPYLLLSLLAIIFLGMFDHYFLTLQQGQLMLSIIVGISLANA